MIDSIGGYMQKRKAILGNSNGKPFSISRDQTLSLPHCRTYGWERSQHQVHLWTPCLREVQSCINSLTAAEQWANTSLPFCFRKRSSTPRHRPKFCSACDIQWQKKKVGAINGPSERNSRIQKPERYPHHGVVMYCEYRTLHVSSDN